MPRLELNRPSNTMPMVSSVVPTKITTFEPSLSRKRPAIGEPNAIASTTGIRM